MYSLLFLDKLESPDITINLDGLFTIFCLSAFNIDSFEYGIYPFCSNASINGIIPPWINCEYI